MQVFTLPLGPYQANCYVLLCEDGKAAVVDPGFYCDELVDFLYEHDAKVEAILLTHGHADHISGADALRAETGAKIYIHKLDAPYTNSGLSLSAQTGYPECNFTADVLLEDGDTIRIGNHTLRVLHTPGHTPGGVCFLEETDHLFFTGDTLFSRTIGRVDLPGGSKEQILESLYKIWNIEGDYAVYPGHEHSSTLEFEKTRNMFLRRMGRQ